MCLLFIHVMLASIPARAFGQSGDLIVKASGKDVGRSELKLPSIRIKVDYSGFMTINPQRFGQKYVGKVANPQDILILSKAAKKCKSVQGNTKLWCSTEMNYTRIPHVFKYLEENLTRNHQICCLDF